MKVHILYHFLNTPFGGANQFLKSLKNYLVEKKLYEEDISKADIILFNSHLIGGGKGQVFSKILEIKRKYPDKIIVHRVDGPVSLYQKNSKFGIDYFIYRFNELFSDATIFQSKWSRDKNIKLGLKTSKQNTIIINAPDSKIFNKNNRNNKNRKVKIISTSWSSNMNKGFSVYEWLDKNLNFSKYEMTFVGNSPIKFKNIKSLKPVDSMKLSKLLKEHDIYLTASKNDPCSNSLIEALHCGIPAIGLNEGGHPEIIGKGGEIFSTNKELLQKIDLVSKNLKNYQKNISLKKMDEVGKEYTSFFSKLKPVKKMNTLSLVKSYFLLGLYKSYIILNYLFMRIKK